ncbi:glutathione S-transferase family protein [Neobacillus mesonae]|uniref:glutathione S-transferase family protein n=1 Tax=Neobacillus mesonae TaxID=1193713 RepID=UPI002041C6F2|nr:glutathione S-transferase C-terminal domain-containing protein [Neobacillus mesonae]MCM3567235.1 glutathione S-transferase C-terminal domain-containing protein [Neobacillus mesonae]
MSGIEEQTFCQLDFSKIKNKTGAAETEQVNRPNNRFTAPFGHNPGELSIEAGRYRLLWSPHCPWAHRSVIVRKLLGLEDVISLGTVNPIRSEQGWEFSLDDAGVDPVLGIRYLSEAYFHSDPEYSGRASVPAVADIQTKKVVYNDYLTLTNIFETAWAPFHKKGAPDLYPEHLRKDIDELNDVIYHDINKGVYKCGSADSQEDYEKAYDALFARLDELEQRLASQRYLFGDFISDSDVRLYVSLARFDVIYYTEYKANRNRLIDFPNLWGYARDLYQTPGFGDTTDFEAMKKAQYASGNNPLNIIPKGPDLSGWSTPHHRERLSK